jgi:hypothetical protein
MMQTRMVIVAAFVAVPAAVPALLLEAQPTTPALVPASELRAFKFHASLAAALQSSATTRSDLKRLQQ